jgi:hypothetical protein
VAVLVRLVSGVGLNYLRALESLQTTKENISGECRSSVSIAAQKVLTKKRSEFLQLDRPLFK